MKKQQKGNENENEIKMSVFCFIQSLKNVHTLLKAHFNQHTAVFFNCMKQELDCTLSSVSVKYGCSELSSSSLESNVVV